MIAGVTATRSGVTREQVTALASALINLGVTELHHGDCVGGDAQADAVAAALLIRRVAHPPDNVKLRAFCASDVVLPVKPYKERNRDIVEVCGILFGLPEQAEEQRFGGTWSTVRYARQINRRLVLILPDGEMVGD